MNKPEMPEQEIEQLIVQAAGFHRPPRGMKDRLRRQVQSATRFTTYRRWIMRSTIGLAASLAAAVTLWVILVPGATVTLADVREAVQAQRWIYLKIDDSESWVSIHEPLSYYRSETGMVRMQNTHTGVYQVYDPQRDPDVIRQDVGPAAEGSAWEAMLAMFEDAGANPAMDLEQVADNVDGQATVRFDGYLIDAMDNRHLMMQFWVSRDTRLPMRMRFRTGPASELGEWVVGNFQFLDEGPGSIHELGVPDGLAIVEHDLKADPLADRPELVQRAVRGSEQAIRDWPRQWRLVQWSDDTDEIDIIHWSTEGDAVPDWRRPEVAQNRIHYARYFSQEDHARYRLPRPATADEVVQWAQQQTPVWLQIADGRRFFEQTGLLPEPMRNGQPVQLRVRRGGMSSGMLNSNWITGIQWPLVNRDLGQIVEVAGPEESPEPGTIFFRSQLQSHDGTAWRHDHFIDPERDHVCVKTVWWTQRDGQWVRVRMHELLDFDRLPGGQWYATRYRLTTYGDAARGTTGRATTRHAHVHLPGDDGFAPELFDGESLLERARASGAEIRID